MITLQDMPDDILEIICKKLKLKDVSSLNVALCKKIKESKRELLLDEDNLDRIPSCYHKNIMFLQD